MKKLLSMLVMLALVFSLSATAMASPTGASPEEIALFNTTGPAAALGMPALAMETLGETVGAEFVAQAVASAQSAPVEGLPEALPEALRSVYDGLVEEGATPEQAINAVSMIVKSVRMGTIDNMDAYVYDLLIAYSVASGTASIYMISGNSEDANRIATIAGKDSWEIESSLPVDFYDQMKEWKLVMIKENKGDRVLATDLGTPLATFGPITAPKPEAQ